jgi:xylulokinase
VISELRAIGGGARSGLWLQVKADVTGIPVRAPRVTEAACLGAALLAGEGAGCYPSAAQTADGVLQGGRLFEPDRVRRLRYDDRYALYKEIYPTLRELSHRL